MTQRIIKFRAWDRANKQWIPVKDACDIDNQGQLYPAEWRDPTVPNLRDCVVIQFTGLVDKNDREIYEGDVVEIQGMNVEVEYHSGGFGVRYFVSETFSWLATFDSSDVTVVGNVHEHPTLIFHPLT